MNHDLIALPGIDVVHDLDVFPWPWEDGSAARIRAFDIFEHVWHPLPFMRECWRVLEPGGVLEIHTAWWQSKNAHTDPDHKRSVTDESFDYWVPGTALHDRYGPAYTGGFARFEKLRHGLDGQEFFIVLRRIG